MGDLKLACKLKLAPRGVTDTMQNTTGGGHFALEQELGRLKKQLKENFY